MQSFSIRATIKQSLKAISKHIPVLLAGIIAMTLYSVALKYLFSSPTKQLISRQMGLFQLLIVSVFDITSGTLFSLAQILYLSAAILIYQKKDLSLKSFFSSISSYIRALPVILLFLLGAVLVIAIPTYFGMPSSGILDSSTAAPAAQRIASKTVLDRFVPFTALGIIGNTLYQIFFIFVLPIYLLRDGETLSSFKKSFVITKAPAVSFRVLILLFMFQVLKLPITLLSFPAKKFCLDNFVLGSPQFRACLETAGALSYFLYQIVLVFAAFATVSAYKQTQIK